MLPRSRARSSATDETAWSGFAQAISATACTSLRYTDANGNAYLGRTMELTADLPYQIVYFPAGETFSSDLGDGHPPLAYTSQYGMLAIAMANTALDGGDPPEVDDLKVIDGQNEVGLTFSVLAYPTAAGAQSQIEMTRAVLDAIDLGSWTLGQFATVAEVKAALADQSVVLAPLRVLRGAEPPFHFALHDRTGASIVIEFEAGQEMVYDNPVGVMTNGPQFSWHLTNLRNYTHLTTNVDRSSGSFGGFEVSQPDSGIATVGLPSSDTSVGRFVRAVYYSSFAEKVADSDQAVRTVAHIMNNFDRPKNISVSGAGEAGALTAGLGLPPDKATEYTTWTRLGDLARGLFFVRDYQALNYTLFDIRKLADTDAVKIMPLAATHGMAVDKTGDLLAAPSTSRGKP